MKKINLKSLVFWFILLVAGTSLGWLQSSQEPEGLPQEKEVRIVSTIIDGDTLILEPDEKVRLIGIDTPERGEAGYQEAKNALTNLAAPGDSVTVWYDKDPYDQYGRTLLYIENDKGIFINQELLAAGWARPLFFEPNTAHRESFRSAHQEAQEADLGLFATE